MNEYNDFVEEFCKEFDKAINILTNRMRDEIRPIESAMQDEILKATEKIEAKYNPKIKEIKDSHMPGIEFYQKEKEAGLAKARESYLASIRKKYGID